MVATAFDLMGNYYHITIVKKDLSLRQSSDIVVLITQIKPVMSAFLN